VQPRVQRFRMVEEQRARRGECEASAATLDQPLPDSHLERADLLRDRRLRERQRDGRSRKRLLPGDLAEGEQTTRVDHSLNL
jgi:hypothetical protein